MKTLLVPTDFSVNAESAMAYAVQLAEVLNVNLVFFHANQELIPTDLPFNMYKDIEKQKEESSLEALKNEVAQIYQSLAITKNENRITYLTKYSHQFIKEVTAIVEEKSIDLIVMGTRGASGLKKMFFGSNTTKVMDAVKCPVLAIPDNYTFRAIKKIAYASELVNTEKEVSQMIDFVKQMKASLEIFHVFPVYPKEADIEELDNDAFIENLRVKFQHAHIQLHFVNTSRDNEINQGIRMFVKIYKPGLLVMFTRERGLFDKLFDSSKTEEIAYQLDIPLLALRGE